MIRAIRIATAAMLGMIFLVYAFPPLNVGGVIGTIIGATIADFALYG